MKRRTFLARSATGIAACGTAAACAAESAEETAARLQKWSVAPADVCPPPFAQLSYAQAGEDLILRTIFGHFLKVDKPDYIDIGAYDPIQGSNTYLFYQMGCRGVLVEPNPAFVTKLRAVRPGDVVVPAGIGVGPEEATDYYIIEGDGQLNTFSLDEVARLQRLRPNCVKQVVKMPLLNINNVLAQNFPHGPPALFSTDIEGLDLAMLRSLDFAKWRPKIFIVETLIIDTMRVEQDIVDFMASKDYVLRGGNFANSIFYDRHIFPPS